MPLILDITTECPVVGQMVPGAGRLTSEADWKPVAWRQEKPKRSQGGCPSHLAGGMLLCPGRQSPGSELWAVGVRIPCGRTFRSWGQAWATWETGLDVTQGLANLFSFHSKLELPEHCTAMTHTPHPAQITGTLNSTDTKENVLNKSLYRKFDNRQNSSLMVDVGMVVIPGWMLALIRKKVVRAYLGDGNVQCVDPVGCSLEFIQINIFELGI